MKNFFLKIIEYVAPSLAASHYERLWFSTRRYKMNSEETRLRNKATISLLPNGVVTYRWGSGPVVLIIHGWNGRGTQPYVLIGELVSRGYQVLSFDAPGHGESTGNESSLLMFADAIGELAKQNPHINAVVTHSFGGLVAAYCLKQKIIEIDCLISFAPPTSLIVLLAAWCRFLKMPTAIEQRLKQKISQRYLPKALAEIEVSKLADGLRLPVLVLHDKNDNDLNIRAGQQFANAFVNSKFVATEQLGHRKILKDRETLLHVVNFLTTNINQ